MRHQDAVELANFDTSPLDKVHAGLPKMRVGQLYSLLNMVLFAVAAALLWYYDAPHMNAQNAAALAVGGALLGHLLWCQNPRNPYVRRTARWLWQRECERARKWIWELEGRTGYIWRFAKELEHIDALGDNPHSRPRVQLVLDSREGRSPDPYTYTVALKALQRMSIICNSWERYCRAYGEANALRSNEMDLQLGYEISDQVLDARNPNWGTTIVDVAPDEHGLYQPTK